MVVSDKIIDEIESAHNHKIVVLKAIRDIQYEINTIINNTSSIGLNNEGEKDYSDKCVEICNVLQHIENIILS